MHKARGKKHIKKIVILAACLLIAGAVVFAFIMNAKTAYIVPILMYHSIDEHSKSSKLSVSPESFARQMKFLHDNNYNVVTLEKAVSYILKKEKPPARTIAVTFDDGFENNYTVAYPVLKKYNIPATMFVIVNRVGSPGFVNWEEVREMADSGLITIGNHTKVHFWLLGLDDRFLREEVIDSKKILEEKLGRSVNTFCYPMGSFDKESKMAVENAGYLCAVATSPSDVSLYDVYALRRVKISRSSDNLFVFWGNTTRLYTWFKGRKYTE